MSPGNGGIRLARVTLFASAAVGLAGAAHAASGQPVPWRTALVLIPFVILVINRLAARQRSLPVLLGLLGGTELVLHEAFMAVSRAASCSATVPSAAADASGAMVMHPAARHSAGGAGGQLAMYCGPAIGHASAAMGFSAAMLAAHVVATGLTALVLAKGDAAIWALASWLAFTLMVSPRAAVLLPRRQRPLLGAGTIFVLAGSQHRQAWHRRGPPQPVCALP